MEIRKCAKADQSFKDCAMNAPNNSCLGAKHPSTIRFLFEDDTFEVFGMDQLHSIELGLLQWVLELILFKTKNQNDTENYQKFSLLKDLQTLDQEMAHIHLPHNFESVPPLRFWSSWHAHDVIS